MTDDRTLGAASAAQGAYEQARAAYEARRWADSVKYAAQVLQSEPHHAGAFELLSAARRQLERASSPAGEQRILSVFMCDLVDSTRLSAALGREPYRDLLRSVQEVCASAITRYEGRVAQYLGDGILAYFSYPQAHEDDPLRAALAALATREGVAQLGRRVALPKGSELAVRIGIDTGVVMVGAMGGGHWTTTDSIVGDAPNFAARLQAMAPANGIIASEATYERIAPYVRAKPHRARLFKGFEGRRRSYEVLAAIHALEPTEAAIQRGPLVGRDSEWSALSNAWRDVLAGERRTLALVGEAGMGKTRLADELVNVVHATGGTKLAIRCSALHRHVPFHPVTMAIRRLLGLHTRELAPSLEEVRERLSSSAVSGPIDALVEPVARLLGAAPDDEQLPEQRRERTLASLVSLVRSLVAAHASSALGKRFLLLIEDAHDADPSTLELIARLAAQVEEPFAIVITARPESSIAGYLPGVQLVPVGPLTDDACRTLAVRVLGARRQLVDSVVVRAGGNPLFAEELAHSLDRGQAPGSLPPALDLLLTARIDTVEPGLRELVVAASVIGSLFEIADLVELAGRPRESIDEALTRLSADGLLDLDPERPETVRRFRHALFREAAYQRLLPSDKARKHLKLAELYERDRSAGRMIPPAIIARHLREGGAPVRALDWWHRAALDARATAAHAEAVEHYDAALALLSAIDDAGQRTLAALPLQLGFAGSASMVMGYTAERVQKAFEQADALAAAMPHSPERFTATIGLHTFALVQGQLERAEQLVVGALRDVDGRNLPALEGMAYTSQAYVRFYRGRLDEARALCERGKHAVPTIGVPQDPALANRLLVGLIEQLSGDRATGERLCSEAMAASDRIPGDRAAFTKAFLLTYLAWNAQMLDDALTAQTYAARAIALSQQHGFAQWLGAATLHLGAALCELGQLPVGLATLEAALGAWRAAGAGLLTPYFMGRLALAKLKVGDTAAALALLGDAIGMARHNDEQIYLAELYRLRAKAHVAQAELGLAADDLASAVAVADALSQRVFAARARSDQGELDERMGRAAPSQQNRGEEMKEIVRLEEPA